MERYAPHVKDLASRDVVSRSMTMEILKVAVAITPTIFIYTWNIPAKLSMNDC